MKTYQKNLFISLMMIEIFSTQFLFAQDHQNDFFTNNNNRQLHYQIYNWLDIKDLKKMRLVSRSLNEGLLRYWTANIHQIFRNQHQLQNVCITDSENKPSESLSKVIEMQGSFEPYNPHSVAMALKNHLGMRPNPATLSSLRLNLNYLLKHANIFWENDIFPHLVRNMMYFSHGNEKGYKSFIFDAAAPFFYALANYYPELNSKQSKSQIYINLKKLFNLGENSDYAKYDFKDTRTLIGPSLIELQQNFKELSPEEYLMLITIKYLAPYLEKSYQKEYNKRKSLRDHFENNSHKRPLPNGEILPPIGENPFIEDENYSSFSCIDSKYPKKHNAKMRNFGFKRSYSDLCEVMGLTNNDKESKIDIYSLSRMVTANFWGSYVGHDEMYLDMRRVEPSSFPSDVWDLQRILIHVFMTLYDYKDGKAQPSKDFYQWKDAKLRARDIPPFQRLIIENIEFLMQQIIFQTNGNKSLKKYSIDYFLFQLLENKIFMQHSMEDIIPNFTKACLIAIENFPPTMNPESIARSIKDFLNKNYNSSRKSEVINEIVTNLSVKDPNQAKWAERIIEYLVN